MKKSTLFAAVMAVAGVLAFAGCGAAPVGPDAGLQGQPGADSTQTGTEQSAAGAGDTAAAGGDASAQSTEAVKGEEAAGEWVYVYSKNHTDYADGTSYDYFNMSDDDYGIESHLMIRKQDGKLLADLKLNEYESSEKLYGVPLSYKESAAYEGCPNDKWNLEFSKLFDDGESIRRVTLTDDGMLIVSEIYDYVDADDPSVNFKSINAYYYLHPDDERMKDVNELRYFDTVTVSNVVELVNNLQNNRKIIVKPGTYNFSLVSTSQIKNPCVRNNYGAVDVNNINNLRIEAENGAKVLFCIDTAYDPVLTFTECQHISLDGITAGHNVEPGYCSGSVLSFNDVYGLDISKCGLYGSGTYGIEANDTYDINVSDTDIYECTYGLLDLRSIGSAHFTNCTMRDSGDMSMINIYGAYDVTFEGCTFSGNHVDSETCYFVELGEYNTATFRDCVFRNNKFYTFANREVTLENCKDESNSAGFKALLDDGPQVSAEDLKKAYDEAVIKQSEIDTKLENGALMDQLTLNQTAYEEYELWDNLLNSIWSYLGSTLGEEEMEALRTEQQGWIKEKEAKMKSDAEGFAGGSMQPMVQYGTGAELTHARVTEFVARYLSKPAG